MGDAAPPARSGAAWESREIECVLRHYEERGPKWVAGRLRRTVREVRGMAARLGIAERPEPRRRWTRDEDDMLIREHRLVRAREMAESLGRSENAVRIRMHDLGLRTYGSNLKECPDVGAPGGADDGAKG